MSGAIRRVAVRGSVQGVGYRAWVERQAIARRLEGWVRNKADGSVEALFSGPADVVIEMVALCRRGPAAARVDAVHEETANSQALDLRRTGERFSVLPTV
jgi:acylphosphatase